jgi:S1-C subfamily serine protease
MPAKAANSDALAIIAGLLVGGLLDQEAEEQAKREKELKAQNELMRRYIADRLLQEHLARQAENQRIESELKRRKEVAAKPERPSMSTGSGFFAATPGYIVTNAHVIDGYRLFYARDRDGKLFSATFIAKDTSADLALLQVKTKRQGLPIGTFSSVAKGQKVYAIGYPVPSVQGSESKITDGIISSFTGLKNDDNRFQISTPIQPGNSGGPLVNERAEVIGVIVAKASEQKYMEASGSLPQNVNYAVRTDVLAKFLKANHIGLGGYSSQRNPLEFADANTVMIISTAEPINLPVDTQITVADAEADAWTKASTAGSCSALDGYLQIYKGSMNYPNAVKARSIAETNAWKEAQRLNTLSGYRDYETLCPGSARRSEIQKSIAALEAHEAKLKAELDRLNIAVKTNSCSGMELYILQNPNGNYLSSAKDYLRKIEESHFNYARIANSVSAWDDLIENCPNSWFVGDARRIRREVSEKAESKQREKQQLATMQSMYKDKKYAELSTYSKEIIDVGGAKAVPHAFAGLADLQLGKLIDAEQEFKKALEFAPRDQNLRMSLGTVSLILGNLAGSLDSISGIDLSQLPPSQKKDVYENLVIVHYRLMNDAESLKYLEKTAEIDRASADRLRKLLMVKDPNNLFGAFLSSNRSRLTEDHWWAIFMAQPLAMGEWVKAANMSVVYTDRVPDTRYGWYARALARFAIGEMEDAEKSFAIGYQRDPKLLTKVAKFFYDRKAVDALKYAHALLVRIDPVNANQFKDRYLSAESHD